MFEILSGSCQLDFVEVRVKVVSDSSFEFYDELTKKGEVRKSQKVISDYHIEVANNAVQ